jgi:hypothetical protein
MYAHTRLGVPIVVSGGGQGSLLPGRGRVALRVRRESNLEDSADFLETRVSAENIRFYGLISNILQYQHGGRAKFWDGGNTRR